MMICSRAVMSRRKKGVVPARYSDDQVSVGAKRYKQSIRVLVVNIKYSIPSPHMCEGLYNAPDAWPLVPDFTPRYVGP